MKSFFTDRFSSAENKQTGPEGSLPPDEAPAAARAASAQNGTCPSRCAAATGVRDPGVSSQALSGGRGTWAVWQPCAGRRCLLAPQSCGGAGAVAQRPCLRGDSQGRSHKWLLLSTWLLGVRQSRRSKIWVLLKGFCRMARQEGKRPAP